VHPEGEDWATYVGARRESELAELIEAESLKARETREVGTNAFRDGAVPTAGTGITRFPAADVAVRRGRRPCR
jgi:type I restriction enzyme R subunit